MNRLYDDDWLTSMCDPMRTGSGDLGDLIDLDPSFNSTRAYHTSYTDEAARPLPDQFEACCDLWTLGTERHRAIQNMPVLMRNAGIEDGVVAFWTVWMDALRYTQPRLLAYLAYMVERLLSMKVVLKPPGSLYLHCAATVSHYIKVILDGIFGLEHFRNEIIWKQTSGHSDAKGQSQDTILVYSTTAHPMGNPSYQPYDQRYIASHRWFYWIVSRVGDVALPDAGDYRLLDRKVVDALGRFPEQTRFLKGLFAWLGFRQATVPYVRPGRIASTSKYGPCDPLEPRAGSPRLLYDLAAAYLVLSWRNLHPPGGGVCWASHWAVRSRGAQLCRCAGRQPVLQRYDFDQSRRHRRIRRRIFR